MAAYGLPDSGDRSWVDVCSVFQRTWFVRAWTIQEFLFAKKSHLRIGRISLTWEQLFAVSVNVRIYTDLNNVIFGTREASLQIRNVWKLWLLKSNHEPFLFEGRKVIEKNKSPWWKPWIEKMIAPAIKVAMPRLSLSKPSLDELLFATSRYESTNSLDKVFSIIALSRDGKLENVDYRKKLA